MAVDMDVYFLYELRKSENSPEADRALLKVLQPAWRNAIEPEGEWAEAVMEKKQGEMLRQCLERTKNTHAKLIGKFEGWPEGEVFYQDKGEGLAQFWLAKSGYGEPWIVFSEAESENDFWRIINEDELLGSMRAVPPASKVTALFFTENDFDLTSVK